MTKKLVSLLLSVLMLLSCFSAGFAASAQTAQAERADALTEEASADEIISAMIGKVRAVFAGKTAAVSELETKIAAYAGKMTTATPSDEDLAGYNELVDAYNKLTDEQKAELDVVSFDKLFHLAQDREYYLYREQVKAETGKYPTAKVAYPEAEKNVIAILGNAGYIACFEEAKALYTAVNNSKLSAQEKLDAFAAASENARIYSSLWSTSNLCFYSKIDSSSVAKSFFTIAQAFEKEYVKADPFTEKQPAKLSRPSAKNYPDGENDPQYIADFAAYMENQKAIAEYNCRKANHTAKYDIQGMEAVSEAVPEYKAVTQLTKDALAAIEAFEADNSNLAPAKQVVADFDKLTPYQQTVIQKSTAVKVLTEPKEYSTSWSTSASYIYTCYNRCADIAQYDKLNAFIATVNAIEEPYNNDDIAKVREAYDAVPSSLRSSIPEEVTEKYKAILACIGPDTPSLEKPDLSIYTETVVDYPDGTSHRQVTQAIPEIQDALTEQLLPLLGVEGGLPSVISSNIYTNDFIVEICKLLYPLLGGLTNLLEVTPTDLASKLTEPKFADAVKALNAAQVAGDYYAGKNGTEPDYWSQLKVKNGYFGFYDGDREGFLDAAAALFRPISLLTMALTFENSISTTNGTYTYNAYEDLVPIFEILDLEGYMSSHDYTMYVKEISEKDKNMAMDARIRPILVPIVNLVDRFAKAPLDTLLNVLPKLGWALKSNLINDQITTLISKIKLVSITPPDLSAEGLYNLLAGDEGVFKIALDDNNSITIDKAKFLKFIDDIAGCGTAVVKNSVARGQAYRFGIESDKADAFVVLFRWLYNEITGSNNMNAIKGAISGSDLNGAAKTLIKSVLDAVVEMPADTAISTVVNMFASATVEVSMFRLYNPNSGEHFYTGNVSEKDYLVSLGWKYEGIGWKAPSYSSVPVYRLYNQNSGEHHYTTSVSEKIYLTSLGWKDEGIGWYSDDTQGVALYRQYNPNAFANNHNYTTSKEENDWLVSLGWQAEGIGWYGLA